MLCFIRNNKACAKHALLMKRPQKLVTYRKRIIVNIDKKDQGSNYCDNRFSNVLVGNKYAPLMMMKRPKFATQDWWSPYLVGISENGSGRKIAHWGNMFSTSVFDHAKSFFFFFSLVCFLLFVFASLSSQCSQVKVFWIYWWFFEFSD